MNKALTACKIRGSSESRLKSHRLTSSLSCTILPGNFSFEMACLLLRHRENLNGTQQAISRQAMRLCCTNPMFLSAYRSTQSFTCSACGSSLLSAHLLDLHLSEVHDPFFEIQAAKRMSVFRCLVEVCLAHFSSEHLAIAFCLPCCMHIGYTAMRLYTWIAHLNSALL